MFSQGIYENISNQEYHGSIGVSRSAISELKKSPLHYWDSYINSEKPEKKETQAMNIGSAVHCLILEPEKFNDNFAIIPDYNPYTNEGKKFKRDFYDLNKEKIILKNDEYEKSEIMSESVKRHKKAKKFLEGNYKVEQSIFWKDEETDILCKARPDLWHLDLNLICDLKTSADPIPKSFSKTIKENCYHIQAAMQIDAILKTTGHKIDQFCFIVIPNSRPFVPYIYVIGEEVISLGRKEYKDALKILKKCQEENNWEIDRESVIGLEIPYYDLRANTFSMLKEICKC